jgi:hypothetical protein
VAATGVIFLVAWLHAPRGWGARVYGALVALGALTTMAVAARHVWIQHLPEGAVPACGAGLKFLLEEFPLGEVVRSSGVGEVIESRSPHYTKGQLVTGLVGWQEYAVADGGGRRMNAVPPGVSPEDAVSLFGITGLTAYFGLLDVTKPKAGETVVVSGAAGATGSVVGQIAKIVGCRVVGIAGGPEKCAWLVKDLGFDAAVDYKRGDVGKDLAAACPKGIDVYFDNVGGEILDAVLLQLSRGARISLCGAISTYSEEAPPPGPRNLMQLVMKHAHMEGFLVLDYVPRFAEAVAKLGQWKAEGKLQSKVDVVDGLEHTPAAFRRLFTGGNTGKLLVRVG